MKPARQTETWIIAANRDQERHLTLSDGRQLAYTDLGDPAGYPLVFGHGMPGSRLEGHFFHGRAMSHGFRILTPDRPGIDKSAFRSRRTLLDYPDDIGQLMDALGLDRFCHIGWSSGSSRTLACGYALGSRMDLGICLSGYTHFAEYEGAHPLLAATRWPGPMLARHSKLLFRVVAGIVTRLSRHYPGLYLRQAKQLISDEDQYILSTCSSDGLFKQDQLACLNSGGRAIATDLLTELEDWQFRLKEVHIPIWIYQGGKDPFIPVDYANHLASHLRDADLTLMPDAGHLYPLTETFQDILFTRLRQHLQPSGNLHAPENRGNVG
ncbi:MAG: alpha/beta hydrolase [Marinobacter sp.]|uniref:alpha/beta fold hydrolase n=1 Tax=Marinobacter sp. TaxID=50741 RepID=UPI003296C634